MGCGDTLRKLNNDPRNLIESHIQNFEEFLFEEGAHTIDELATHFDMSRTRAYDILELMQSSGSAYHFRRGNSRYWASLRLFESIEKT